MSRNVVYQVSKDRVRLTVYLDESAESPREWENIGTMVCSHTKYRLGDEQAQNMYKYPSWLEWLRGEVLVPSGDEDGVVYLPLYLYEHSGLWMNTTGFHCPWDSGQVGWIYALKEKFGEKYDEREVKKVLRQEVDVYSAYLEGRVFGYVIEQENHCQGCNRAEWEHIDSCWGFYGDDAKEAMISQVDEEYVGLFSDFWK